MKKLPANLRASIYTQRCDEKACHDIKPLEHFLSQVRKAAQIASSHESNLLILPGHSLGFRTEFHKEYHEENDVKPNPRYSEQAVNEGIKHLQAVADEFGIILLGEINQTYWFHPNQPVTSLPRQIIFKGTDSPSLKRNLLDALTSGERDMVLNNKRFRTILCGENNVLTTPPGKPMYLPAGSTWDWSYDVLINPGHDTMRRWVNINPRFEYWSREGRIVIYVVNNITKKWSNAFRIYRDGRLIIDGNVETRNDISKHVDNRWRVVTIDI